MRNKREKNKSSPPPDMKLSIQFLAIIFSFSLIVAQIRASLVVEMSEP